MELVGREVELYELLEGEEKSGKDLLDVVLGEVDGVNLAYINSVGHRYNELVEVAASQVDVKAHFGILFGV